MDRKQIAQQVSELKTKGDLLNLLNLIKKTEIEDMGFDSSMYHPFTESPPPHHRPSGTCRWARLCRSDPCRDIHRARSPRCRRR